MKPKTEKDVARFERAQNRSQVQSDSFSGRKTDEEGPLTLDYGIQVNLPDLPGNVEFSFSCVIVSSNEKGTIISSPRNLKRSVKVQSEPKVLVSTESNTDTSSETPSSAVLPFMRFDDRQFKSFCGVTKQFYSFLLFKVGPKLKESRYVSKDTKILLLLVKLKLNVPFSVLGSFFNLSDKTARLLFYRVLDVVFSVVKDFVVWLDKPTIQARMPQAFKALYPNTRVIIDASEIECERPTSVRQRVLMYSNYKARFTVKFLIGIAPSGEITFISKAYGGRTTDTEITVKSGFIDLIEEGDVVMADKGFPSVETDLNKAGALLVMPPFKSGDRQFSEKQNKDGYECASVRIHVERCIARMKIFEILNFLPSYLLPYIDKILVVISFFCNCFPDLIQS